VGWQYLSLFEPAAPQAGWWLKIWPKPSKQSLSSGTTPHTILSFGDVNSSRPPPSIPFKGPCHMHKTGLILDCEHQLSPLYILE